MPWKLPMKATINHGWKMDIINMKEDLSAQDRAMW